MIKPSTSRCIQFKTKNICFISYIYKVLLHLGLLLLKKKIINSPHHNNVLFLFFPSSLFDKCWFELLLIISFVPQSINIPACTNECVESRNYYNMCKQIDNKIHFSTEQKTKYLNFFSLCPNWDTRDYFSGKK